MLHSYKLLEVRSATFHNNLSTLSEFGSHVHIMVFRVTYYSDLHIALTFLLLRHQVMIVMFYSVQATNLTFVGRK